MSLEENILDLKLNVQESLLDFITNPRIFQNLANNNINKDMLFDPLGYSKKIILIHIITMMELLMLM